MNTAVLALLQVMRMVSCRDCAEQLHSLDCAQQRLYLTFKLHCSVITVAVKFRVGQKPLKFKVTSEANCSRVNFSSNSKSSLRSSFHDFAQSLLCRWHIWH